METTGRFDSSVKVKLFICVKRFTRLAGGGCAMLHLNIQTSLKKFFGLMRFKMRRDEVRFWIRLRRISPLTLVLLIADLHIYTSDIFFCF